MGCWASFQQLEPLTAAGFFPAPPGNMAGQAGTGSLPRQIEQANIFLGKNHPKMEFPRTFSNPKGPQAGKIQGSWARRPRAAARHSPAGKRESFFSPRGPTPTCKRRTPQPCPRPGRHDSNLPFIAFSSSSSRRFLEAVQQAPMLLHGLRSPSCVLQASSTPCWRLLSPAPCTGSCTARPWLLPAAISAQLMAEQQAATKGRGRRARHCPGLLGEPKRAGLRPSASIYP